MFFQFEGIPICESNVSFESLKFFLQYLSIVLVKFDLNDRKSSLMLRFFSLRMLICCSIVRYGFAI